MTIQKRKVFSTIVALGQARLAGPHQSIISLGPGQWALAQGDGWTSCLEATNIIVGWGKATIVFAKINHRQI